MVQFFAFSETANNMLLERRAGKPGVGPFDGEDPYAGVGTSGSMAEVNGDDSMEAAVSFKG